MGCGNSKYAGELNDKATQHTTCKIREPETTTTDLPVTDVTKEIEGIDDIKFPEKDLNIDENKEKDNRRMGRYRTSTN